MNRPVPLSLVARATYRRVFAIPPRRQHPIARAALHTSPSAPPGDSKPKDPANPSPKQAATQPPRKTMAQLDEEMRLKMEGISGDGGASGVEYEDGKAEGLKRGVKSNMFRVI